VTPQEKACIRDLAFALRRIALWSRKAYPSPTTEDMVSAVETRLQAVADRLGDEG